MVQEIVSLRRRPNVLIAAAGNETCPADLEPREPLLPAALEGVLGVSAAANLAGALAGYSNADDFYGTANDGIPALGGDVAGDLSTEGLHGPWTAPQVFSAAGTEHNHTGIGRSSGASFATPVASGFAAALWSEMPGATASEILDAVATDPNGSGERRAVPLQQDGLH